MRLISILLLVCVHTFAAEYYVATTGSDSNDGSLDKPFATIQKAADVMQAGDKCLIRAGVYRETVIPKNSGSAGSPIVFEAYNKERVIISGCEVISGWQAHEGKIYKASMDWDLGLGNNQVFVDGKMAIEGRSPNIDYKYPEDECGLYAECGPSWGKPKPEGSLILPVLARFDYNRTENKYLVNSTDGGKTAEGIKRPKDFWKGGLYWGNSKVWRSSSAKIIASDETSITLDNKHWETDDHFKRSIGFLTGIYGAMDSPGEWFHDANGTLYMYPPASDDPSNHVVEAKKRLLGFKIWDKTHIIIKGLYFFGTSASILRGDYCIVDGCHFRYVSHYTYSEAPRERDHIKSGNGGVFLAGDFLKFMNSSVVYSAGGGIHIVHEAFDSTKNGDSRYDDSDSMLIENNLIHDINYYGSNEAGISWSWIRNSHITRNTVYRVGRSCINGGGGGSWTGWPNRWSYNLMHDAMYMTGDGGVFYCYGTTARKSEFDHNWLYTSYSGMGGLLYLDGVGRDWQIHHNVYWIKDGRNYRCSGPFPAWNIVYNNTFVDTAKGTERPGMNALECKFNVDSCGLKDITKFDFSLKEGSPAIDAGQKNVWFQGFENLSDGSKKGRSSIFPDSIEITDYKGSAPDLGAYEYGGENWKPGHTWGEPDWVYPFNPSKSHTKGSLPNWRMAQPKMDYHAQGLVVAGKNWKLNIYNGKGAQIIQQHSADNGKRKQVVLFKNMASGVYFAVLKSQSMKQTLPLLIK